VETVFPISRNWWRSSRPFTVATYIEQLGTTTSKPSVKHHLAPIQQFDYLTIGGVLEVLHMMNRRAEAVERLTSWVR
jgi:hypothetical protein